MNEDVSVYHVTLESHEPRAATGRDARIRDLFEEVLQCVENAHEALDQEYVSTEAELKRRKRRRKPIQKMLRARLDALLGEA